MLARVPRDPARTRALLRLAQRRGSILGAGGTVFVLGMDAAREAFARDRELRFGAPSVHKMKLGPFILGMDDSPRYQRQKKQLEIALRDAALDLPGIVEDVCDEVVEGIPSAGGTVDLLGDFVDPVVTRFTARFYGVTFDAAPRSRVLAVPDGEATFAEWLRVLGAIIVSSTPAPFGLEEVACAAAEELRGHLDRIVGSDESDAGPPPDSVMGRLLAESARRKRDPEVLEHDRGLDPDEIAASVGGLMLAGRTVGRSFVFALHQLLQRPEHRDAAVVAAREGRSGEVLDHLLEALRFHPPFLALPRYAARRTTLAVGTSSERTVEAGTTVLISPFAAMHDPAGVPHPDEFDPHRPDDAYLHFATGRHVCLGKRVARIVLERMGAALLSHPAFVQTPPGALRFRGPLVSSYNLRLQGRA